MFLTKSMRGYYINGYCIIQNFNYSRKMIMTETTKILFTFEVEVMPCTFECAATVQKDVL